MRATPLLAVCALAVQTASFAASAAARDATLSAGGVVRLGVGGREYRLEPLALLRNWTAAKPLGGHEVAPSGVVEMALTSDGRPLLDATIMLRQRDEGRVVLGCRFIAREDVSTQALGWLLALDAADADGRTWRIGETHGHFAHTAADGVHLAQDRAASFAFDLGASGDTLRLEAGGPPSVAAAARGDMRPLQPKAGGPPSVAAAARGDMHSPESIDCLIQDNRNWSDEYHIRLGALGERRLTKGESVAFSLVLSLASGEPLAAHAATPFVIEAGEEWIPLDNRRDIVAGSALDFSGIFPADAPAGRYGWLRNIDGHFEFEALPDKPQRFYGVNLCLTANYPDHATADALVTRLRRLGYNAVRIHHHDGAWAKALSGRGRPARGLSGRGRPARETAAGEPPAPPDDIDRLDYLLARCFENGIYATTDLYVSRPVPWRDIGVDQDGDVDIHVFKMLCALYEPAFRNWAKFAEDFLLHENPYTGRRYVDEPAMPLLSLVNEGGFFVGWNGGGRDDPRVAAAWREWMTARRAADPSFASDLTPDQTPRVFWWLDVHPAIAQWTGELEAKMVSRMKAHLRSLGCRALLSNDNCGPHYAALQRATADLDYIDDHFYIDHPRFPETSWKLPSTCQNNNPLLGDGHLAPSEQAFTRMLDKPFTVSEWNFAAPSRFRGMGGLLAGAMAALQNWDGLWRFDYSYLDSELGDRGTHGPHYFDLATDPVGQAAERAVLCLFRRGDLAPLTDGAALWDTPESATLPDKTLWGYPPWCDAAWTMRVGSCLDPEAARGLCVLRREEAETIPEAPLREGGGGKAAGGSIAGESVRLDRERGALTVVTPRTCGGFAPSGRLDAGPLSFEIVESQKSNVESLFATNHSSLVTRHSSLRGGAPVATTLWLSSLDGKPIAISSRLLLTHVTDVQGEGAKFADDTMTTLLSLGNRPLARNGTVHVTIQVNAPKDCTVFELATNGERLGAIPAEAADGLLHFTATVSGPNGARLLYEIARNEKQ